MTKHTAIARWLLICCGLVFAMVILGGVTRLTGSGLSMVNWQPVFGILPPLNQADWQNLFAQYQQSPEFKHVNFAMDLAGFKDIFWLEYLHRVLGRVIGLAFLLPFLYFWLRGKIPAPLTPKLIGLFVLGGLQGLLGWYMVKSGLVDNPHVSQYRLTAHLALAVLVYGFMLWIALGLLPMAKKLSQARLSGLRTAAFVLLGMISLTLISGGFVAGLKAGMTYNTFPLMAGQWLPDGLLSMGPWYRNLFENVTTVQFDHRVLALLTLICILVFWLRARHAALPRQAQIGLHLLLVIGVIQVSLGITTLLLQVPIALGAAHQAGALSLFTVMLFLSQRLGNKFPPLASP